MNEIKKFSLIRFTTQTPFQVDFEWWRKNDRNWRVEIYSLLCPEHQETVVNFSDNQLVDWIDSETAEVRQVDHLQYILINHCAKQEGFVTEHTALVEAVFRLLLTNGNIPLSSEELSQRLKRPADIILRTLTGMRVYKGLRPNIS